MDNPMQTQKGRLVSLDLIKIVAAFMVVFYHFRFFSLGRFAGGSYIPSLPQLLLCPCAASIPLFFMVSGALMLNKNCTTKEIYAKAARAALLILVWNAAVGFPEWFLRALIVLYLLYPILNRAFRAERKLWLYLILAGFFAMPFCYNLVMNLWERFAPDFRVVILGRTLSLQTLPLHTGVWRLYSVLYFLLGGLLLNRKVKPAVSVLAILCGLGLTLFDVMATSNYTREAADAVNRCFPTVGGLLTAFGIFTLLRRFDAVTNERVRTVTASLGGVGVLAIYLFHVRIRKLLMATVLPLQAYPLPLMLAIDIAVCLVCWGAGVLLQKIPLVKELMRL